MTKVLVLCDHVDKNRTEVNGEYDAVISINPTPPDQNLRLQIDNITHRVLSQLDPLSQDLLEIAAYIYYADCSTARGTETDVYADKWKRRFDFVIPVSNPTIWNNSNIINLLEESLSFLTGDEYSFSFVSPRPKPAQLYMTFTDIISPFPNSDCICLFSGGLDSLIGSLYILKEKGELPLLVSHRSIPKVSTLQKELVESIRERNREWQFPHISMWVNRMGNRAVEETQRARSFLYLSIATVVASQLGMSKIYFCENGVISVNIPISSQNVGSLLTRSTHPKFIMLFEQLARNVIADIHIENPFIFQTKTEMLKKLEDWNQSELIQATVSCSYTQGRSKMQRHCGICSQCVNRRFSIIASGIEKHDKSEFYEKDIFLDPLEDGKETAYVEGYVRTAVDISKMDDIRFFSKYPELDEALSISNGSTEKYAQNLYQLFQHHATEVIEVATSKCNEYQRELLAGDLPDNCLISMLASRRHLKREIMNVQEYVVKLKSIEPGKKQFKEFEDLCIDVLKMLFCPPLGQPSVQSRTADGLNIRDALFPNHSEDGIWHRIKEKVPHNFIIFEFKNWNKKIDQIAIEQGRKYTDRKSMGNLCIIISRKELSNSGIKSQDAVYINSNAIIPVITDAHLIEMMSKKENKEDPAAVIEQLIEEILLRH